MNRSIVILLALLLMSASTSAASAAVRVEQPGRSIGYFIGDVLEQQIYLDASEGFVSTINGSRSSSSSSDFESGERIDEYLFRLPAVQKNSTWFAALKNLVAGTSQQRFDLRYQLINVPTGTKTISLPELTLETGAGTIVTIDAWPFNISPLSSDTNKEREGSTQPLPDRHAVQLLGTSDSFKSNLLIMLGALFVSLCLWLGWWIYRHFKDIRLLPFAKARQTLKRLPAAAAASDDAEWIALHLAFNQTAGRSVSSSTVADLLHSAPWLKPKSEQIKNFYSASAERFFQQSAESSGFDIKALANSLYHLERRQPATVNRAASGSVTGSSTVTSVAVTPDAADAAVSSAVSSAVADR